MEEIWYDLIIKERDRRLALSKETGDYHFIVAHGLTDAIRLYDKAIEIKQEKEPN